MGKTTPIVRPRGGRERDGVGGEEATCSLKMSPHKGFVTVSFSPARESEGGGGGDGAFIPPRRVGESWGAAPGAGGAGGAGNGTSLGENEKKRKRKDKIQATDRSEASGWSQALPGGDRVALAPQLLNQFHIISGEHAEVAVGPVAAPPALVDHLDVGDDVLRVERDLGVISWKETERRGRVKTNLNQTPQKPLLAEKK